MKKVFQIKLKNMTKVFALVVATSLVTFTGCKSYDEDISGLQTQIDQVVTDVAGLKTAVTALQASVNGMTYIKSITLGTDGKLTITPSTGANIVYDAKNFVTYDVTLTNNVLTVNGVNKGTVTIPALTFTADGKLMSGTTQVADLTAWLKSGLTVVDGFLAVNGQKTTVAIPVAAGKTVKDVTLDGVNVKVTYTDNTTATFANVPFAASVSATTGNLVVNGVDTGVLIKNTFSVIDGFLAVNGVKTTVKIPAENKSSVIINKVGGVIVSATVSDGTDSFTVKLNPTNELLAGLLFVPEWINGGVNAVELGFIVDTTRVYNTAGTVVTNLTYGSGNVEALFTQQDVIFRFNPTSADVSKTTWSFINNTARVNAPGLSNAPGDATTLFAAPVYTSNNDGSGKFSLKVATWVDAPATKSHLFALQANGKDFYSGADSKVVSDYVKVVTAPYNAYIANKTITAAFTHYTMTKPAYTGANDFTIVYNAATKTNLNALVLATAANATGSPVEKSFADYKFGTLGTDYKFTFDEVSILGADGITDQSAFINIESNGDITVLNGTAAIDRTPVVKVTLSNAAGKVLAFGYIKFNIAAASTSPFSYTLAGGSYNYNTLFKATAGIASDYTPIELTWEKLNTDVLPVLGLSNTQFQTLYSSASSTVTGKFNGATMSAGDLSVIGTSLVWSASGTPGVDSYVVKYNITPYAKFGTYELTYAITPATGAPLKLVFTFTVNKPVLDKTILAGYQVPGLPSDMLTQGTNYGGGYAMQIYLGEGFAYGSTTLRAMFGTAANKIEGATHQLTFKVGAKGSYQIGASLNGTDIPTTANATSGATPYPAGLLPVAANGVSLDAAVGTGGQTGTLMALTSALTVPEKIYNMNFYTYYPNTEKDSTAFNVHFKNPLTIVEISPLTPGFTLTDVITGQVDTLDVAPNYNVMFGDKIAIKRGLAQTANTTTTVNAADFNILTSNLTYAFSTTGYSYAGISLAGGSYAASVLQWINNGTAINTTVPVAKITPTITTPYAVATKAANEISVKSSSAPGNIKRK